MNYPEVYTEEERDAVEHHISTRFGEYKSVLHELVSPDIHVDICVIEPTEERNHYTLVTMGMGAHRMNVPKQLAEYKLERAELMICLPPDWILSRGDLAVSYDDEDNKDKNSPNNEIWYWPLRWLKILARLPKENNTWLGFGHTIPNGPEAEPFAENTGLGCIMLIQPLQFEEEAEICQMPDGGQVAFYQMFPIYADEMYYKLENDAEHLLEKFAYDPEMENVLVLDVNRKSVMR